MKGIAFAFAALVALAPIAAAHDCEQQHDAQEPDTEEESCKFITPTLVPPDYVRIDPDCPPLGP